MGLNPKTQAILDGIRNKKPPVEPTHPVVKGFGRVASNGACVVVEFNRVLTELERAQVEAALSEFFTTGGA